MSKAIDLANQWTSINSHLVVTEWIQCADEMSIELRRLDAENKELKDQRRNWLDTDLTASALVEQEKEIEQLREKLKHASEQEPVAYRYKASRMAFNSKRSKWHYQETFPSVENRKTHGIMHLEKLYAAPVQFYELLTLLKTALPHIVGMGIKEQIEQKINELEQGK